MKNATRGTKEIAISKAEFEVYGNRVISDYFVNLEVRNGRVVNNIDNTAVTRDLYDILNSDNTCKNLFLSRYYKFNLDKDFILRISIKDNL